MCSGQEITTYYRKLNTIDQIHDPQYVTISDS